MDSIVLDSSIWVSIFNQNDSQHKKASELFSVLQEQDVRFMVSNYVDLECTSVLLTRVDLSSSLQWIQFVKTSQNVDFKTFTEDEHEAIRDLFCSLKDKSLSFVDISLLYLFRNGMKVLSFDQKLQRFLR